MPAFTSFCSLRGYALQLLASVASFHIAACARPQPDAAADTPRNTAGRARSVVQIDPDAGVFLPVTETLAVRSSELARTEALLIVEQDTSGGNMVRLNGRFAGELRAALSDGTLQTECQSTGATGAQAKP